jgi:hypothetical protein
MTTFDTILVAMSLAMYALFIVSAYYFVKKGMKPTDAIMEVCASLTFTVGGLNRETALWNVFVILSLILFAWIFTVPGYTALFFVTWVISWVVQLAVHFGNGTEYKNYKYFGFTAMQYFSK